MLIHELTEHECRDVLKRTNLARLACSRHDQPYIVQIHFDFDGGSFYSFSALGQEIDWMRANPKVCVEVDDITDKVALDDGNRLRSISGAHRRVCRCRGAGNGLGESRSSAWLRRTRRSWEGESIGCW